MYARETYTLCYFFNLYKWGSYVNAYVRAPLFLNTDTFYWKYQHSLITVIIVIIIAIIVVISIRQ